MSLPNRSPSWTDYYGECLAHPGVVSRVEQLLAGSGAASVSVREATGALSGKGTTFDQVARVCAVLASLGALKVLGDGRYVLDPAEFEKTRSERCASLNALSWVGALPSESGECELLVASPSDGAELIGEIFERQFLDLRTTIRSLVAEARSRVLLAAPFWDLEVATDLADLLKRRQADGVHVAILSRQPQVGSANERALVHLREVLPASTGCEIRFLERPSSTDPFGSSTFHFKAACVDAAHVYLGSANFNTAGLASRWELGVRLGGRRARTISELLESLFAASRPLR